MHPFLISAVPLPSNGIEQKAAASAGYKLQTKLLLLLLLFAVVALNLHRFLLSGSYYLFIYAIAASVSGLDGYGNCLHVADCF